MKPVARRRRGIREAGRNRAVDHDLARESTARSRDVGEGRSA